jgi:hypothetical protein
LTLPAEQVHGGSTQTRGCVRPVPKDCGKAWRLRQLCKCYPAFSYRRARAAERIYRDSRSDVVYVLRSECAHGGEVITSNGPAAGTAAAITLAALDPSVRIPTTRIHKSNRRGTQT